MIAILTEKQIVAGQIAQALNIEVKGNEDCFCGRGFVLIWTSGSPVSLLPPEDNGDTFALAVRRKQVKKGMMEDKAAVRQLNLIQSVFDRCDSIIAVIGTGR
jgi:DNA topoisomerase-3